MIKTSEELNFPGYCPICEQNVRFAAERKPFRDHLLCPSCPNGSKPRERALMLAIRLVRPDWQNSRIHESSPMKRGTSLVIRERCKKYTATHYYPEQKLGSVCQDYQNENLECQTFSSDCFDIVVSLDVMEHVNRPDLAFAEIARTLKSGGCYIFTAPTYKALTKTVRRAIIYEDGDIEHIQEPPEYHGNPINPKGSLVTFHYGYDLPELIKNWSGLDVTVMRFHDHYHGVIGEFTEVYVCDKR